MATAKYYLYRNLRTGGFSIKQRGLVVDRAKFVTMSNVKFKVNELGRERVLKEKAKNVHAYMVADNYKTIQDVMWQPDKFREATYNPYENETFVDAKTGEPILEASFAIATRGKVYVR